MKSCDRFEVSTARRCGRRRILLALALAACTAGPAFAICQRAAPQDAVPLDPDGLETGAAPAGASAPGAGASLVKGWVEALRGGRLENLPAGVRTIDSYGDRLFVEIPAEALKEIGRRRLVFHPFADADLLSVGGERFDATLGEPAMTPEWRTGGPGALSKRPYIVKFDAPIKEEWIADLGALGAEIVQYQPHFGYLVIAPAGLEGRLGAMSHVAFHGEYHAAYKADAALRARAARDASITLRVTYFDLPGWKARVDAIQRDGARLVSIDEGPSTSSRAWLHQAVLENVRTKDLVRILRDPEVYWAEEWFPPEMDDERAAQITAGSYSAGVPTAGYHAWLAGLGADGAGVTVAIADSGLDTGETSTLHEDLRGRTTFATALCTTNRDRNGHGTNVASIAVGDPRLPGGTGILDPQSFYWGAGSAPAAGLYFQKVLDSLDCGATYAGQPNTLAQDAVRNGGAEIGSHSFTDGITPGSAYTSTAQAWDARVRDADTGTGGNQPYAVVFSAGNSGPGAGTLTSPKAAKNIITVGSSENYRPGQCPGITGCDGPADDIDVLVGSSSRGPTADGRIKPDVTAPGHVIGGAKSSAVATYDCYCDNPSYGGCCAAVGVDGSDKYTVYSGTSQAAPRVGGASAIVFDWFQGRYGAFPSPAMNKAILINGAVDMKTLDVPNSNEGWGRIHLGNSLDSPLAAQHVDQTTVIGSTGDPSAFTASYVVQDPAEPMKTTLVWTDAPGAVSCNPCLVNDLDLLVIQGATTWRGNNFTNGFSNTGTTPDILNNIEGVHLPGGTLSCAPFQVKVRAQTLNGDGVPGNPDTTDQDFALVVSNAGSSGVPVVRVPSSGLSDGCDGDGFLDRRETADLTLQIQNGGCADAAGVQATLSVLSAPPGASITVSPAGAETIGDIVSGATVPHVWQVSLDDDPNSFCGQKARLQALFTDASLRTWTEVIEIVLDADAFSLVTNTDPATVDNSFSKDADWSLRSCRTTSAPTSWHMGDTDCTGIPRDATSRELTFAYTLAPGDVMKELSFQHAFNGYWNGSTVMDQVQVDIDPENDGSYVTLQTWRHGIDNPTSMTLAGPYDLTPYNASRAATIKVRFRFQSAANWVGGPNNAAGWDVDDIVLKYDSIVCDPNSCPVCTNPSGLPNNTAADADACFTSGIQVTWPQDPNSWGDTGGTRTYTVLRDGSPVASGPCSGSIAYGTTSCIDTTAAAGISYEYRVRYENGCAQSATTSGALASDQNCAPPPVNDGSSGGNPVQITYSGGNLTLTWDAAPGATRYNLYMGAIGTFWSHAIFTAAGLDGADSCFEPSTSATFAAPPGSAYFLVAADNGIVESALGEASPPTPRPYASPACSPH